MKRYIILLLVVSALTIGNKELCYATDNKSVHGNQGLELEESEIPGLEKEAMAGSPDSALKLGLYYAVVMVNLEKGEYWMKIAAENGDTTGMNNLWYMLNMQENELARIRALFWLKRSAEAGDPLAKERLEELDKMQ